MKFKKAVLISTFSFISVLIMFIACGKQGSEWEGTIEEVEGVTVIRNPKEPVYIEDVFSLEEELSIGETEGGEEYLFSQIRDIAVDEKENIFVMDVKESHIKVFDRNGEYLRTIGKKGEGPGELSRPRMISINQNELMVLDIIQRKLSFFTFGGKFLRNLSTKEVWALYSRIDSKGNIIITEGFTDPKYLCYKLKKFDPDMNLLAEIASSPAPDLRKGFNPFMAFSYWIIDKDDNIVYGYPKDYELQIINPQGELIKKITREYDPVEVTEEEIEEEKKDAPPQIKFEFSKYHSAFRRFTHDDEGRIFVQTWEKTQDGEGFYYDIFDLEGRYIVKIPLRTRPIVWKKNKLYTIEEDEMGFQVVKRYRINWDI